MSMKEKNMNFIEFKDKVCNLFTCHYNISGKNYTKNYMKVFRNYVEMKMKRC